MRKKATSKRLAVHAIAGTHVVLLTFNLKKSDCAGLRGFGIHRTDHTEEEAYWLQGTKVFRENDPKLAPGARHSTREQPIQDFWWSDYSAKPAHNYTYRVVALKGEPAALESFAEVKVEITTEDPAGGDHDVYFNRGATASQEFARRFGNRKPPEDNMDHPTWAWLSRGAHEAILDFIDRAKDEHWGLRVGAYEFRLPTVLNAIDDAHDRGVDVKIFYDAGEAFPRDENRVEVAKARIKSLCTERVPKPDALSHNKFIVLLRNGTPQAVLTGSTNFSHGGVFGQSNVIHIVEDTEVAKAYLDYWQRLAKNPEKKNLAPALSSDFKIAGKRLPPKGTTAVFSPRDSLDALEHYAWLAGQAKDAVFMTFAFGMHKLFQEAFATGKSRLRYALFEKLLGPGVRKEKRAEETAKMVKLRRMVENRFAVGNHIREQDLAGWLREKLTELNTHVEYVHTKYMLLDPLGSDPVVVTGSANFSGASSNANDENMIIIRGNQRVADIYLGEFMRLWEHNAFRDWIAHRDPAVANEPQYLDSTDSWWKRYFGETALSRHREYFAG